MMYCGEPTVTDRPPLITFSPPSDGWAQAKAGKAGRTTVGGRNRITVAAFKRITTESAAKTLSRLTADETVKFHKFRSKIHANRWLAGWAQAAGTGFCLLAGPRVLYTRPERTLSVSTSRKPSANILARLAAHRPEDPRRFGALGALILAWAPPRPPHFQPRCREDV